MTMKVKLERVFNGVALRTPEVMGQTEDLPSVGRQFWLSSPPLDPTAGNIRLVHTSPVVAILEEAGDGALVVTFQTENSVYRVTRLAE